MPKITYCITTAIDYPNAKPHIGHAYEKIIADALARWHELLGEKIFLLTGTDEHGQKIEKAAKEAGKIPQQFVDEMSAYFKQLCDKLNVKYDAFIRTTDKKHVKLAQEIFTKVFDKGLIYKGTYSGWYCTGCEAFYTEKDLVDGACPIHQKTVEKLSEESYFFKLSEFQKKIIEHIEQHPDFIQPESRRNEILNRLKEPLKDLSVSRTTFKWGIPVPQDKKHVIYVWFYALLNYITGCGENWPAQTQLIGKDIAWFHTVIWPAILFAAELPLPKTVYCHGWLTVDGQKMSKSIGNIVDPVAVIDKYGTDPLRYFLLREVPAGEDGDFSENALIDKNNSDLADALGNLLQRTSVLIHKKFHGNIPICGKLTDKENQLNEAIPDTAKLNELIQDYKWHHALEQIWTYIAKCNKYVNDTEPWKQNDPDRLATILYTLVEHLRMIGILVWPFIPSSAEKIACQIGQKVGKLKDAKFKKTTKGKLAPSEILFRKVEKQIEDPFSMLNLRVAKILDVKPHPNADKLYVVQIDSGEKRQLVAGMRPFYQPGQLIGKQIVVISNLKPANLRGQLSQGMLLAAEKEGVVRILEPQGKPGDQVYAEGITPKATQLISIEDFQKITLTTKGKIAIYGSKQLRTTSGTVNVDIPDGAKIR